MGTTSDKGQGGRKREQYKRWDAVGSDGLLVTPQEHRPRSTVIHRRLLPCGDMPLPKVVRRILGNLLHPGVYQPPSTEPLGQDCAGLESTPTGLDLQPPPGSSGGLNSLPNDSSPFVLLLSETIPRPRCRVPRPAGIVPPPQIPICLPRSPSLALFSGRLRLSS
jgi:hypothetical protein